MKWLCLLPRLLLRVAVIAAAMIGPGRAIATSAPVEFDAGALHVSVGGYVKLDVIHDFDAIGSTDSFDPRKIPVDHGGATDTRIHARESRLSLSAVQSVEGKDLNFFFEGDFFGTNNGLRMRHAYAQYGALLVGQTWSTFMDEKNIPPTIDFETPLAAPLVRQGLVRLTFPLRRSGEWSFALEESDPEIMLPAGVTGTTERTTPDVTGRVRFICERGHVQLSGFVGRTRLRPSIGDTQSVTIGGVLISARWRPFGRDALYAEVAYGPGLGRYRGAASAELDATGRLRTIDVFAATVGFEHYWSARWSSNAVFSPARVRKRAGDPLDADHSLDYTAANVRYWFIDQRAWAGLEYLYGKHALRSGDEGTAQRMQFAVRINL